MRYIPAKVVFDDQEKELLKGYMSEWDETGEKRAAIDASPEFDICTVREGDQYVRVSVFIISHTQTTRTAAHLQSLMSRFKGSSSICLIKGGSTASSIR